MSSFPTGVCVVTTVDTDGRPRGMTCTSLSSVSLDPPIVSLCFAATSKTLGAVRYHGSFGVNLLGIHGISLARLFADSSRRPFEGVLWHTADGTDLPRLGRDTIAFAACRVTDTKTVGDHVVVFGNVFAVGCDTGAPLLYGRRQFVAWPGTADEEADTPQTPRGGTAAALLPPTG